MTRYVPFISIHRVEGACLLAKQQYRMYAQSLGQFHRDEEDIQLMITWKSHKAVALVLVSAECQLQSKMSNVENGTAGVEITRERV